MFLECKRQVTVPFDLQLLHFPGIEKSLEKDMEREQLIGMSVRQKLETRSMRKLKHTPPNRSHHPGKRSGAVMDTLGSA